MPTILFRHLILFIISSLFVGAQNYTSDKKYCLENIDVSQFTQVDNKFYYFSEKKASWFQAFLACRTLGGHLASFDGGEELNQLSQHLLGKLPTNRKWWISAADLNIDGIFHWYGTGKQFNYTSISFRKPSTWKKVEQCVNLFYINKTYHVNDSKCKDEEYYICDLDAGKMSTTNV